MSQGVLGCSGLFRGVPGCPGMCWGVPECSSVPGVPGFSTLPVQLLV